MKEKKCTYCSEEILLEAKKCKYCGEFVDKQLREIKVNEEPKKLIVSKANNQRFALLSAAIIGLLSTFMPWVHISSVRTIYGFENAGLFTFFLFLVPVIIILSHKKAKPIGKGLLLISVIPSIIAGFIGIQRFVQFSSLISNMSENAFTLRISDSMTIGIGLYLVIIIGFVLPFLAFLIKEKSK